MIAALLLVAGVALLVGGAELLVRGASRLAAAAAVPPVIIGLTVVAFGTSAPELAVSVGATRSGAPDIALGNVVGSNIFNVLFILGVSALIAPLVVQRRLARLDAPLMVAATVLLFVLALDGRIGRIDGLVLTAGLAGYVTFLLWNARRDFAESDDAGAARVRAPTPGSSGVLLAALGALAGLALLAGGSKLFVDGAVVLARHLGVSDIVIGLTVIAAGTSLPEAATSVMASLRGERDIAVGNVVGSNIFNILGIVGVCGLLGADGLAVAPAFLRLDLLVMIAVALAMVPILLTGLRIGRGEALLLLGAWAGYTLYLVLGATDPGAAGMPGDIVGMLTPVP